MEISNGKINNKEWLARDAWDAMEAACFFAQIDIKVHIKVYLHGDTVNNPKAKEYLGTTRTWAISAPPLWFINKAIKERFPEISQVLLSVIREYIEGLLPDERNKVLQDYAYIARELALVANKDNNPEFQKKIWIYANEIALTYFKEKKKVPSQRDIAPFLKKRLEKDGHHYGEGTVRNKLTGWVFAPSDGDV